MTDRITESCRCGKGACPYCMGVSEDQTKLEVVKTHVYVLREWALHAETLQGKTEFEEGYIAACKMARQRADDILRVLRGED